MSDATPQPDAFPPVLTAADCIAYLRLDSLPGNPRERLRNLYRRQRLPVVKRGKLLLFRRESVDRWLAAAERGYGSRTSSPAR